jgi:hypothetical protein
MAIQRAASMPARGEDVATDRPAVIDTFQQRCKNAA